ncbi:hypothetical protein HF521_020216 [Silurus meridionalis]|uniref:Uncharacterized protein n=1 Tax=Silurus meridionalis TaxID=175797 RepID=A0A8T0BHP8_SILME|nr:hypothetical protein HF521_020216 [Silurus meridionalis]
MPPRKMHRGTGNPCLSQTANDSTVWVEEDIGMPSAVANYLCFTAQAGPTESAKGMNLGCWDSLLNPLEVSWAYQRNTQEGGRPLDNPKGAITQWTFPQSLSGASVYRVEKEPPQEMEGLRSSVAEGATTE